MRKNFLNTFSTALLCLFLFACQKIGLDTKQSVNSGSIDMAAANNYTYIDSFSTVDNNNDSTETMTVLGNQLTNPYLIPNITQAYHNLGIYNVPVKVTNLYVRFKPTMAQFKYLDSLMDTKGVELFDIPLNYQVLIEGDYYQDPSIPAEQPTWQYAVVPANFTFPSGIQYEQLAQVHIPTDTYSAVETEAERLAELQNQALMANNNAIVQPRTPTCPEGYHWDVAENECIPDGCPPGYYWNGSECVPQGCPAGYHWDDAVGGCGVNPPPPPAPDASVPAGTITVDETQALTGLATSTTNGGSYRLAPLRKARIVARRWFKVERVYTDNNGHFQCTKKFKHKVRINVKFKNDDAVVRCLRGARVWNVFSPLNKVIGVFSGNKSNITYNFAQYKDRKAKGNQYWVGGTVHNGLQEYKDFALAQGIGLPPANLSILITNWSDKGMGATPML